jgi:hypothetical protein
LSKKKKKKKKKNQKKKKKKKKRGTGKDHFGCPRHMGMVVDAIVVRHDMLKREGIE